MPFVISLGAWAGANSKPGSVARQPPPTPTTASQPIEPRLVGMVAGIRQLISAADVRPYSCGEACGYGSRARGAKEPGSLVVEAMREGVLLDGKA